MAPFFLSLFFLAIVAPVAFAASAYPCHDGKGSMGNGVTCTEVKLPSGLCTSCPLRPPNGKGLFIKCHDIYDTNNGACMGAMEKYVDANPCDPVRAAAMDKLKSNPNDKGAHEIMDYFLYSVCEQCCDCIPMGANKDFYSQYAATGSLWDPARGNCPAHAFYDICKVTPQVKYFSIIGQSASAQAKALPKACGELNGWFNSGASKGWQENPQSNISGNLRTFLNNLLGSIQCSNKKTWDACFDLESKQNHLGVPEDNPPADDGSGDSDAYDPEDDTTETDTTETDTTETDTTETDTTETDTTGTDSNDPAGTDTNPPSSDTDTTIDASAPGTPANPSTPQTTADPASTASSSSDTTSTSTDPASSADPTSIPEPPVDPVVTDGDNDANASGSTTKRRACFPADATVELQDGAVKSMAQLRIGDMVRVAGNRFESVYLFSHADITAYSASHLSFVTNNNVQLTLTDGHMLSLNGEMKEARFIRTGDRVEAHDGTLQTVRKITRNIVKAGLFNPHTASGSIVVNGIVCSTFTNAVKDAAANALLAPLRSLFRFGVITQETAGGMFRKGGEGILF